MPSRTSVIAQAIFDRTIVHVRDFESDDGFAQTTASRTMVQAVGYRSLLAVPMLRDDRPIGAIAVGRPPLDGAARPFSDRDIDLLKTFAEQAVIAIKNTRLFEAEQASKRELQESLEYQTATSEVLSVISQSPNDLQPVLEAIVETARRLCQSDRAMYFQLLEDRYHLVAERGTDPEFLAWVRDNPMSPELGSGSTVGRAARERRTIHVPDLAGDPEYAESPIQRRGRARSRLAVPLLRGDVVFGVILVARDAVRPFTDRQIKLVETFADQAVIAIENTRLFEAEQASKRELTEALEQQTATADVLKVISRSALDVQKVLDALVESAARLCNAYDAAIFQVFGDGLRIVAHHGRLPIPGPVGQHTFPIVPELITGRVVIERRTIQVADLLAEADEYPESHGIALQLGFRTLLTVPLLRAGEAIGAIAIRRAEVRPFTERQIELVNTFADQAVIAIENTRLFEEVEARTRELTQSLEQQTATSEVLGVISSSPGALQPVFETILSNAVRICEAKFGNLLLYEGDVFRFVAMYGAPPEFAELRRRNPLVPAEGSLARIAATKQVQRVADMKTEQTYLDRMPAAVELADAAGARTLLCVPMLKDNELIGVIGIYRQEVRPFTDKQIELVKSFANQAVIAIENARLFEAEQASKRELQESLEYQTATSEVLKVISRSPNELQPVLDTILETAQQLCHSDRAQFFLLENGKYHPVAHKGTDPKFANFLRDNPISAEAGTPSSTGRAARERRTIHVPDVAADAEVARWHLERGAAGKSLLSVPLIRDGLAIGVITLGQMSVRPFTEKQIELVKVFADQAVIAIENTRLFEEVQARTRELQESLQQQTATADVLKVISRSPLQLQSISNTLVEEAARLCEADTCGITRQKGTSLYHVAQYGYPPGLFDYLKSLPMPSGRASLVGRVLLEGRTVQIADASTDPDYRLTEAQRMGGYRTLLGVPLLRQGCVIGVLALTRSKVQPFTKRQIELVTTFADQAVIAIENTRLFEEVQERTHELAKTVEDLEIASQHKNQFVANMSHELRTPLAAILGYAELIQEGFYEPQGPKSLDALSRIRSNGKHLLGLINTVLDIA